MSCFRHLNKAEVYPSKVILFSFTIFISYINGVAEAAKKSPELIQLLELHTQFASITPYAQVS